MTTDRELLELAAKAAGIEFDCDGPAHCGYYTKWRGLPQWNEWDPLTDDGDALRLAVKLCIHLTNSDTDAWASQIAVTAVERLNGDPCAATRRAVVRAAAAIGETL